VLGRTSIGEFLIAGPSENAGVCGQPARANGQIAFGCYAWDRDVDRYVGHSIDVLALRGGAIAQIVAFLEVDARTLERFGLPAALS
jgi:RNA polymerase sigma-70 factor, ECF subfamily